MSIDFDLLKHNAKKLGKRILPFVIVIAFFILWTCGWYGLGKHKGKVIATKEVTEELTTKFEAEKAAYIAEMTYVPEDYERTHEIEELTKYLEKLVAGYAMNSNINKEGCYAICWCFIARLSTKGYFGTTPQDIAEMPNQWQWYDSSNPVRAQDTTIAKNVATAYVDGKFPDDFTTDLCFADLKQDGSVVLRNSFYTNNDTVKYWRYKMD